MEAAGRANSCSLLLWNLDVHERRVLLSSVPVTVARISLEKGTRYRRFDRERVVAQEKLYLAGFEPVTRRYPFTSQHARIFDTAIGRCVIEHDVERELERAGVLASNQAREIRERRHADALLALVAPTSISSIGNIS